MSPGSPLDAQLKLRLARLQLEQEAKREEQEFQFKKELEFRRLDLEREALKVCQLELQGGSKPWVQRVATPPQPLM